MTPNERNTRLGTVVNFSRAVDFRRAPTTAEQRALQRWFPGLTFLEATEMYVRNGGHMVLMQGGRA